MNLLDRLTNAIGEFFSHFFGRSSQPVLPAQKVITQQRRGLQRLSESLTELVFQRKKFEARLNKLKNKKLGLSEDIEVAALKDRDDLAIQLMEELDLVKQEMEETSKNLEMLISEIENAKQVEVELKRQMKESEAQLAVLASKSQSIRMREELHSQFSKLHNEFNHIQPDISGIEENILKLEARLETMDHKNPLWKQEVLQMRKERTDHFRLARLHRLKSDLRKRSLPGQVIVPEIIKTH